LRLFKLNKLKGDEVKRAINLNNFEYIAEYDQLLQQKNMGNVRKNFLKLKKKFKFDQPARSTNDILLTLRKKKEIKPQVALKT